jgi:quercetin dioxygenase-like cupin family protein
LLPFKEKRTAPSITVRKFSSAAEPEDLVWHRDQEDRIVTVAQGDGWFFQRDGELPSPLTEGKTFFIEKNSWHRIIKKRQAKDLIIFIQRII